MTDPEKPDLIKEALIKEDPEALKKLATSASEFIRHQLANAKARRSTSLPDSIPNDEIKEKE